MSCQLARKKLFADCHGFLCSKPFLIFGPGGRLFYAHGSLLAQCSPVLRRDVEGEMREQQLETIHIKDVDGDIDDGTVMRFIEYAYTGDYTTPDPDIVQLPTDPKELQEAFETKSSLLPEDEWTSFKKDKKDRKKSRRSAVTEVIDRGLASPIEEPVTVLEEAESEQESDMVIAGPTLRTTGSDRRRL